MTERRARARATHAAAALVLGIATVSVHAASEREACAQAAAAAPRRVVEIHIAGAGADGAALDDTVRELLGRLTLVTESQLVPSLDVDSASFRSTARPSLLARVGIDMRAQDNANVTVVDGRTGEVTMRRALRREGPPPVIREEVAHVVPAALDPMVLAERDRANAPPELPPPAPSAPAPVPVPAPPPPSPDVPPPRDAVATTSSTRSPLALDLATLAGAGSFASGAGVVARAGGGAAIVWRRGLRPSIGVSGHYIFPFDAGSQTALAHVTAGSLRTMGAIEAYGTTSFAIDVAAGGGIDVVGVEPRSNVLPSDRLAQPTSRVDPIVSSAVTGHLAVGSGTAVSLMLGLDLDLASRRWVVEVDGGGSRSDAFAPSRLRPLAMVGFTFTPFGDARFGPREIAR